MSSTHTAVVIHPKVVSGGQALSSSHRKKIVKVVLLLPVSKKAQAMANADSPYYREYYIDAPKML